MRSVLTTTLLTCWGPSSISAFLLAAPAAPRAFFTPHPVQRLPNVVLATKMVDADGAEIKAALSAYMHFCQERRPSLTADLKASKGAEFSQPLVMKALGAEWKELGDSGQGKFKEQAAADKMRYDAAVASNPENALLAKRGKSKSAKSKEGPKLLSAYIHFCNDRRPTLTEQLKASMGADFKNSVVMVELGKEWKLIDAEAKAKYQAKALVPVD